MKEESEKKLISILGERLQRNVVLRDYVTLKVGGVSDYFFVAKNIEDLVLAANAAFQCNIPYFILGGGCNIVPSDSGFPGLVIKNESSNIIFGTSASTVIADSGVNLGRLINLAAGRDLGGLEFLFGVPGTVGGSVYGNAGAFNYEIGDFVKTVTMLMQVGDEMKVVCKPAAWMNFSYRSSRIKNFYGAKENHPVILTVTLQLVQRRKDEILRLMHDNFLKKKQGQPLNEVSAGSFFRNYGVGKENSAGYLLDQIGAKKLRVGGAAFSSKHANFLINKNGATASDIKSLAETVKEIIKEKYNIELQEEIEYIGRW